MSFEQLKSYLKISPSTRNIFIVISIVVIMFIAFSTSTALALSHDKVYRGVYIDELYVGNSSKSELHNMLNTNIAGNDSERYITITAGNEKKVLSFQDLNVVYDFDAAVDTAYNIGRSGGFVTNIYSILSLGTSGETLNIPISFDENILNNVLDDLYSKTSISPVNPTILEENNEVFLIAGIDGIEFNKKDAFTQVKQAISQIKSSDINLKIKNVKSEKINLDNFYKKLNTKVKESEIKIIESKEYEIVPHTFGKEITKNTLQKSISELEKSGSKKLKLPIKLIVPKLTTEIIEENLFRDELSTYKTTFPTYNQVKINRASNIKIAAKKINNTIIPAGGTFSFNKVVGKRTKAAGYKDAPTFQNGEIVPGVGGGICQVSTTLHNAALLCDFKVVERRNHSFKVGYVPSGMDAAVSYGSLDYKFQNTSNWPIQIQVITNSKNQIVFTILGTNENPDRTVEYFTKNLGTLTFSQKYTDDPTLPVGVEKVTDKGFNGLIVDTYKRILENGKVVKTVKAYGSRYNPYDERITRGTKVVETKAPATIVPTEKPVPTKKPITTDNTQVNNEDAPDISG